MRFKLIVTFVDPDITDKVIQTAKEAGATGDVIIPARGSGLEETRFLGLSLKDKTNMVLFVVEEHSVNKITEAIREKCDLEKPGNGILIVLSIDKVAGLTKQIDKIKDKLKGEQL